MRTGSPAKTPAARIQPLGPAGPRVGGGGSPGQVREPGDRPGPGGGVAGGLRDLDDDLVLPGAEGQAGDAGPLDEVGGVADQADMGVQQGVPARGGGGHDDAPSVVPGVTASLGIVPGRGMTFANDAGPRRNAAAPPSPAAAGSWSRSAPAARMPRTVR